MNDQHRHRCEVRFWISQRNAKGKGWLREQLVEIEKRRGKAAAERLRADIVAQWAAGNRGEKGLWL